jgi:tyrosinase
MRAGSFLLLTLQAALPAFGAPGPAVMVPSNPEDALKQLQALNDAASKQAQEAVSSTAVAARTAKSCTLRNLKVRREWYVSDPVHVLVVTGLAANFCLL